MKNLQADIERIFKLYEPMDKEYVELIRAHHRVVTNEDLTQEAKAKDRAATIEKVQELKRSYYEKAKAEIEKLQEAYKPKVKASKLTTEERLLNVNLWTQTLPVATTDELRQLYLEHKGDPDFQRLFEAELRRREQGGDESKKLPVQVLRAELAAEAVVPELAELQELNKFLAAITNQHYYPAKLTGKQNFKFRTVSADLDAYPISGGVTYRPIFNIR